MAQSCIIVTDGARGRFFTVEEPADARFEGGPRLVEHWDLTNPEGELRGKELFSNLKSGRGRAPGGGPAHGFDDHRDHHEDEIERRFARLVADAALQFAEQHEAARIVLVAEPRFLGMLRFELDARKPPIAVDELPQDLSWHAVPNIQRILTAHGLLTPRREPSLAYRPRGQPPPSSAI